FAARAPIEEAVGVRLLSRAGSKSSQLDEIAAVQWQFRDLFRRDHLAEGRSCGLDGDFRRADLNFLAHRSGSESEIELPVLVDLQPQIFLLGRLESLRLYTQRVSGNRKEWDQVVT